MIVLHSLRILEEKVLNEKIIVVFFTGTSCGACYVIKDKVNEILSSYKEVNCYEIDAVKNPHITSQYEVYTTPLMILFIEGKEYLRYGRNIDLAGFKSEVERYIKLLK